MLKRGFQMTSVKRKLIRFSDMMLNLFALLRSYPSCADGICPGYLQDTNVGLYDYDLNGDGGLTNGQVLGSQNTVPLQQYVNVNNIQGYNGDSNLPFLDPLVGGIPNGNADLIDLDILPKTGLVDLDNEGLLDVGILNELRGSSPLQTSAINNMVAPGSGIVAPTTQVQNINNDVILNNFEDNDLVDLEVL